MIEGSKVVVLGGTQGIGLAVAKRAAREGAKVVVVSSRRESIDAALAELGDRSSGEAVDLRSSSAVRAFFELGLRISISSDDPGIFQCRLLDEYAWLAEQAGFSAAELQRLAAGSFACSLLPPGERAG